MLHAKDAANDFIDLMEETFIDFESFPKRGRPVPDEPWHSEGVRMRPIKNHIVYYWIDEEEPTRRYIARNTVNTA